MNAAQNPLNACPYWVGDILTTMSEIAPAQRWPGTTWEQITDCMLRAADDTHPAGSTGGGGGGQYYPVSIMSSGGDKPMPITNKYTACYMYRRTG